MDIIFTVAALLTWTAASRFLFRRWTRDGIEWNSGEDITPPWIAAAAAVAALFLPVILPVRLFAYAVMSHPPQTRREMEARTRALEARTWALEEENTRLRQEQEGPATGPLSLPAGRRVPEDGAYWESQKERPTP